MGPCNCLVSKRTINENPAIILDSVPQPPYIIRVPNPMCAIVYTPSIPHSQRYDSSPYVTLCMSPFKESRLWLMCAALYRPYFCSLIPCSALVSLSVVYTSSIIYPPNRTRKMCEHCKGQSSRDLFATINPCWIGLCDAHTFS